VISLTGYYNAIQRISGGDADRWMSPLEEACNAWDINTRTRITKFLAQTAHESAGFRRLVENMKYSAAGLMRTWPSRYDAALAAELAYNEYAIAEHSYGGRYGNGPEGAGDGFKYRGRGLIQVTFHDNYLNMGEHIGSDENGNPDPELFLRQPELLEDPLWAASASACFWDVHKCSEAADVDDFLAITRIISGASTTYDERKHWLDVIEEMV
jgi:putative chitinase